MDRQFSVSIDEIQRASDIVQIVGEHVALKKAGKNYKGLCPFHTEKTPSFVVSPDKQLFHCFGCGEGGNVFTFIQKVEKLPFAEAMKFLAKKVGISLKYDTSSFTDKLWEINNFCSEYFQKRLKDSANQGVYDYLTGKREIKQEIIKKFKLGYSPSRKDELFNLLKNNFKMIDIEKSGMVIKKNGNYYDRFRGRIIFPIFDISGRIVGFSGRATKEEEPKYLNSPETPLFYKGKILYGLNFAKHQIIDKKYVIIVEGYLDLISLYQYGISNCVASMGTSLTMAQIEVLSKFTRAAIICFDPDAAGVLAADRVIEALSQESFKIKIALLPEGEDPDTLVRKIGKEKFEEILEKSKSYLQYQISKIIHQRPIQSPEDKAEAVNKACAILQKIKNPILLDDYIKIVSRDLKVDEKFIRLSPYLTLSPQQKIEFPELSVTSSEKNERKLLQVILSNPSYISYAINKISTDDFINNATREIFTTILKIDILNNPDNLYMQIYNACPDNVKNYFTSLMAEEKVPEDIGENDWKRWILKIKSQGTREKIKEIRKEIEKAEKQKENNRSLQLAVQVMEMERKLRDMKL